MGSTDCPLLTQSLIFFLICLCGCLVVVPMVVNRYNFDGECILFGFTDAKSQAKSPKRYMVSGEPFNCEYLIYFSAGLSGYGLIMGIGYMYAACRTRRFKQKGSNNWVIPFLVMDSILACITLIAACVLTVGYAAFCKSIMDDIPSDTVAVNKTCAYFENKNWTSRKSGWKYNVHGYSTLMDIAVFGAWFACGFQIIQVALDIFRFILNRREM